MKSKGYVFIEIYQNPNFLEVHCAMAKCPSEYDKTMKH